MAPPLVLLQDIHLRFGATPLLDGAELSVVSRRDDWVQVQNGAGKTGWLPVKQVEVLPGA